METKKGKGEPYPKLVHLECKSCGRCVIACPKDVLFIGDKLNERGFAYVQYKGEGCVGCGNCYYSCPEPYAIEVHVPAKEKEGS